MNPIRAIRKILAFYRTLKKQRDCCHEWHGPVRIDGGWSEPVPHPHPKFRDFIKVRLQQYVELRVCFKCQKVSPTFKYNQRDENPPDDTLRDNPIYAPRRVFNEKGESV